MLLQDLILDAPYDQNPFVNVWKDDITVYGAGNTLYDKLKAAGFSDLDSYTFPRTWAFVYRKNNTAFQPVSKFSNGLFDRITLNATIDVPVTTGYIRIAKIWPGQSMEAS